MNRARLALAALLACGCITIEDFGTWVVVPDLPKEAPIPEPFAGEVTPALVPTQVSGLLAAPSVDARLYYLETRKLWYRWTYNRWYVAFRWDGAWFPPDEVPAELEPVTPEVERLPELPELPEDPPPR